MYKEFSFSVLCSVVSRTEHMYLKLMIDFISAAVACIAVTTLGRFACLSKVIENASHLRSVLQIKLSKQANFLEDVTFIF